MALAPNETHPLDREIATYNRMRGELELHHASKFVVIQGDALKGTFDTIDNAASFARESLPRGIGFLIRQVGRETGQIPASVLYPSNRTRLMPILEAGFVDRSGISNPADYLRRVGPTITVQVGPGVPILPDEQMPVADPAVNPSFAPRMGNYLALLDTGATDSCIDQVLADQLALPLVDRWRAGGVGGSHEMNVYLAALTISSLGITKSGLFMAVRLTESGQPHAVLIGRDLLTDLMIIYDGRRGSVSVCR